MAGESAHISRHPLDGGGELIAVADQTDGLERLVATEQHVARGFLRHCGWPHARVNLFVFETLRPLVEQLQRASRALGEAKGMAAAAFHGLDGKPMVHAYNPADLTETSVFVNRGLMKRLAMWNDAGAVEALLAHEHAHPLAENLTTRRARTMKAALAGTGGAHTPGGVAQALEHLVHELCLHAPHEVFSNALAIRAGFGEALLALNRLSLSQGRAGLEARAVLAAHLETEVRQGRLSASGAALLLLLASLEAHVRVALETAAFARAGSHDAARALEAMLWREALSHVEAEAGEIYRQLYTSYLALEESMDEAALRDWAARAFAPVMQAVARHGAEFTVSFHFQGLGPCS